MHTTCCAALLVVGAAALQGEGSEIAFWRGVITNDAQRQVYVSNTLNTSKPFLFRETLLSEAAPEQTQFKVLDVGSGPLTKVGFDLGMPAHRLELTAADPLAMSYDRLLAAANVVPTTRAVAVASEALSQKFGAASFDLVCSTNALDHVQDPLQALRSMVEVVKPGHSVIVRVFMNEGKVTGWRGMHRWNFYTNGKGSLLIKGNQTDELDAKEELVKVTAGMRVRCCVNTALTISADHHGRRVMTCRIVKQGKQGGTSRSGKGGGALQLQDSLCTSLR